MAAPRKKPTKKVAQNKEEAPDRIVSKAEQAALDQLILQAMMRYKGEDLELKSKQKELMHLATMAQEYLSSFIVIGYSLQGERAIVTHIPTAKDESALIDLLRSTLIDLANERP
jgi:hypothetical protein